MNDFEKESAMMDMKEEMMSDAVDDVMDDEEEEEEEGDRILKEVLDEIGVDLSQKLTDAPVGIASTASPLANRQPVALGESGSLSSSARPNTDLSGGVSSVGAGASDEDALQARLDALRRG
ncbi:Charged multivesicular body protein 2a [Psilocybe cubensis]|nr:Charged multivesicular body protein 2a [Psilocybe cubensis]KAH9483791.1 Charged multivesicular body protein 2a [Psilocybe cubensis]